MVDSLSALLGCWKTVWLYTLFAYGETNARSDMQFAHGEVRRADKSAGGIDKSTCICWSSIYGLVEHLWFGRTSV